MIWKNRFYATDENGILDGQKIPYFCVVLSKEEAEQVKDKKLALYSTDDRELFSVIGHGSKEFTGELAFYVLFVDK